MLPPPPRLDLDHKKTAQTNHSLNLPTHSFRSPRVSYLGYTTETTLILGKAWLTNACKWLVKPPKVLSSPYENFKHLVYDKAWGAYRVDIGTIYSTYLEAMDEAEQ